MVSGAPYLLWKQNLYMPARGALNSNLSPDFPVIDSTVLPPGDVTFTFSKCSSISNIYFMFTFCLTMVLKYHQFSILAPKISKFESWPLNHPTCINWLYMTFSQSNRGWKSTLSWLVIKSWTLKLQDQKGEISTFTGNL